jgi:DNA helicase-2/ATP-dependent DNA helicase PcrA
MTPSNEQLQIINYNSGNVVVTADPGSGKTFTIVQCISKLLGTLKSYQGVIAISFTNKASDELLKRAKSSCPTLLKSFFGTIDKFCFSEIIMPFASHFLSAKVNIEIEDDKKQTDSFKNLSIKDSELTNSEIEQIKSLLYSGTLPLCLVGTVALFFIRNIPQVLLYLKAKYKYIFIDEYQDCGAIQHAIFKILVANNIIGYAVGDPKQAIYDFSNKYPRYLLSLLSNDQFQNFVLSKNYRCHESITNYASTLYGIKTKPKTDLEVRVFGVTVNGDEKQISNAIVAKLPLIEKHFKVNARNKIAILARSAATLSLIHQSLSIPNKLFSDTPLDNDSSYSGRFFRELLFELFSHQSFEYYSVIEKWFS